jgi:hypothetical protein
VGWRTTRRAAAGLVVVVVAGIAAGGVSAAGVPPSNTSPPTISGHRVQGYLLVASPGVWSGTLPIRFAYQWQRCDRIGGTCTSIVAASAQSYLLTGVDIGHTIRVFVTATNAYGTGTAVSAPTAVIASAAPVNTSPPTISGTARQGQALTAEAGTWSGVRPITFVFDWHRCDSSGAGCVQIPGATGQSYLLVAADVGHTLEVAVTAENAFGTGVARSAATAVVVVAAARVTLTGSRPTVIFGGTLGLSGSVVGGGAGQGVTIDARAFGSRVFRPVATAATSADGSFSATVTPRIRTSYRARLDDGTLATAVTVGVRPRLHLAAIVRHLFSLTALAARSFVGKTVLVQEWSANRHTWLTLGRIHMRSARRGSTVVTSKRFILVLGRGHRIRAFMPLHQHTTGYLPGISNTVRS